MREVTDREKIMDFMSALGAQCRQPARIYLTGGSTAVLHGWRNSTIDIDLRFIPEHDELFRSLPKLKEKLHINVEIVAPSDFIPSLPGWEDRSIFIRRVGKLDFFHYDPYSQALAKIERGHSQDKSDVEAMLNEGLVNTGKLLSLFRQIEPELHRYPAIDPDSFSKAVKEAIELRRKSGE